MRTKKGSITGIKRLSDGHYQIRIQTKCPKTGKPIDVKRRVWCTNEAEAVAEQTRLQDEALGSPRPEIPRLRDYAISWLASRLPTLKNSTRARYAETLDRHILPDLGDTYLDRLRPEDVHGWFARKAAEKAASTANGYLNLLRTLIADAVAQYGLHCNPTERVRAMPLRSLAALEADEPVNMLSAEELSSFLAVLRMRWPQWYALVFTQFATARRFGEVSALRWEDINVERAIITIRRAQWRTLISTPKTDRVVTVPLTDDLRAVLDEWRQTMLSTHHRHVHSGWIFPSRVGQPHQNGSCMRKAFIDCLKEIGLARKFSSHGLRRTANNLLRQVASGEVTRAITGHVTVAMTEHYSHVDAGEKRAAVEKVLSLVRQPPAEPSAQAGTSTAWTSDLRVQCVRRNLLDGQAQRQESE